MKVKKKSKWFYNILLILFVIYFGYYIAMENGYYETVNNSKALETKEAIVKFESDLKDGKDIDLDGYIENKKDYSNKVSDIGLKISTGTENVVNKGLKNIFSFLKAILGD